MAADQCPEPVVLEEGGVRKAICGYTWPGIEYGEPPSCAYTFFEYVDAVRFDDLPAFLRIEAACREWWTPAMDRGAGALLHFAADHGRLALVRFLVEQRGAGVNQRCAATGATPLHRAAAVAHHKHAPSMEVFEYLLAAGADPALRTHAGAGVLDLAVEKGYGWEAGEVRAALAALVARHVDVPKAPEFVYAGGPIGPEAARVLVAWEAAPKLYPPKGWRPPPPAGYVGAVGMRRHSEDPWRPAGDGDGSCMLRPMTPAELEEQAWAC